MTIADGISDILSSVNHIFETDQTQVIRDLLRAEKVVFLDTCFITKLHSIQTEKVFQAFEKIAGTKEKSKIVFVITELILYELKDSAENTLQVKNKEFFEKMSEYGFCLLILKEESVCENVSSFLSYSRKKWNEIFSKVIHDNVSNLSFHKLIKTDKRMPYFGFSEIEYSVPNDHNFIRDILLYLKNAKSNKDSMAEELICTSLFMIFELTHSSKRNTYIFCSHDLYALARLNKAIQTSYPAAQQQFKTIEMFGFVQFMVKERILTSKDEVLRIFRKIMGENVKLVILEKAPFSSIESIITIEDAVEKIFHGEEVALIGRDR